MWPDLREGCRRAFSGSQIYEYSHNLLDDRGGVRRWKANPGSEIADPYTTP